MNSLDGIRCLHRGDVPGVTMARAIIREGKGTLEHGGATCLHPAIATPALLDENRSSIGRRSRGYMVNAMATTDGGEALETAEPGSRREPWKTGNPSKATCIATNVSTRYPSRINAGILRGAHSTKEDRFLHVVVGCIQAGLEVARRVLEIPVGILAVLSNPTPWHLSACTLQGRERGRELAPGKSIIDGHVIACIGRFACLRVKSHENPSDSNASDPSRDRASTTTIELLDLDWLEGRTIIPLPSMESPINNHERNTWDLNHEQ